MVKEVGEAGQLPGRFPSLFLVFLSLFILLVYALLILTNRPFDEE